MTQRITPISKEDFVDIAREIYASRPLPADMRNTDASNVELILANHPELAKAYFNFGLQLLLASTMSERDRELIVLRVSWRAQSLYTWAHHVQHMIKKFSPEDFAAIKEGPEAAHWNADDRDLLRATDQLFESHRIDDATWTALARRYSPRELIEIVFVVGNYLILGMAADSLGIELEAGYAAPEYQLA